MSSVAIEGLPFDVFETIIDILANDDEPSCAQSLKACSLTCKTLLPLCQKALFRSFAFRDEPRKATLIKLVEDTQHNPKFLEYVKKLEYWVGTIDLKNTGLASMVADLSQVLTKLSSVVISFQALLTGEPPNDWKQLPKYTTSTLLSIMHIPTVTSIEINGNLTNFDHFSLLPCTNLSELKLLGVTFADWDNSTPVNTPSKAIKLHRLEISDDAVAYWITRALVPYYDDGISTLDLRELKHLQFSWVMNVDVISKMFQKTTSLESLFLDVKCNNKLNIETISDMISPSLGTLKSLNISIEGHRGVERRLTIARHKGIGQGIRHVLQTLAGQNVISKLKLTIHLYFYHEADFEDDWGAFDETLLAPGWSALKDFNLTFICYPIFQEVKLTDWMRVFPETYLHGLSSTSSIKVTFSAQRNNRLAGAMRIAYDIVSLRHRYG